MFCAICYTLTGQALRAALRLRLCSAHNLPVSRVSCASARVPAFASGRDCAGLPARVRQFCASGGLRLLCWQAGRHGGQLCASASAGLLSDRLRVLSCLLCSALPAARVASAAVLPAGCDQTGGQSCLVLTRCQRCRRAEDKQMFKNKHMFTGLNNETFHGLCGQVLQNFEALRRCLRPFLPVNALTMCSYLVHFTNCEL